MSSQLSHLLAPLVVCCPVASSLRLSKAVEQRPGHLPVWESVLAALSMTNSTNESTAPLAAEVTGLVFNSRNDFMEICGTLSFSLIVACLGLVLFRLLRFVFPEVYKRHGEAIPVGTGVFRQGPHTHDRLRVLEAAGLDGLLLLDFLRLCRDLVGLLGVIFLLTLAPLHYFVSGGMARKVAHAAVDEPRMDLLGKIGIDSIMATDERVPTYVLWVHAALVWFAVVMTVDFIQSAQKDFAEIRLVWLKRLPHPRCSTLLLENIPTDLRNDMKLQEYFERLFGPQTVTRVHIIRSTRRLRRLLANRAAWKLLRETSPGSILNVTGFFSAWSLLARQQQLDHVRHCDDNIRAATQQIREERLRIDASMSSCELIYGTSTGFVTFSSRRWRRLASREQFRVDASEMVPSLAPASDDVYYDNLGQTATHRIGSKLLAAAAFAGLFITWIPLVVAVSGMTSLRVLEERSDSIRWLCQRFPMVANFLQGILATSALRVFMAMLPSLLFGIIATLQAPKSGGEAQEHLQAWYFAFQVVFVVLVTTLERSLLSAMHKALASPLEIASEMARHLPYASHFYVNYLLLGLVAVAFESLRLGSLTSYCLSKKLASQSSSLTSSKFETIESNSYGVRMARCSLAMCIAVVFSQCVPIIMPVAWLFFLHADKIYAYLVIFVEPKQSDSGGEYWRIALKQLLFSLCLYIGLMMGIIGRLASKGDPGTSAPGDPYKLRFGAVVATLLAVVPVMYGYGRVQDLNLQVLPFEDLAELDESHSGRQMPEHDDACPEYVQPECIASDAESDAPPAEALHDT
eukprot:TRINITY_DN30460_c0_g1_i1.p1 TRINITY_DN30460_c0_g1~~TRINITY_DN30460_c0_g1_i1.p1  ORF type:complete len:801 (+),score=120.10 TRINITY_DN30460_c0_g1_i1:71-2473(+)